MRQVILIILIVVCLTNILWRFWTGQTELMTSTLKILKPSQRKIKNLHTTKTKIFYIKTHKTASTSIANLLFRHAFQLRQKVNFPLNPATSYLGSSIGEFDRKLIYPDDSSLLENLFDHVIFQPQIYNFLNNASDFYKMASIRHPISHALSCFRFFEADLPFRRLPGHNFTQKLENFYQNPKIYKDPSHSSHRYQLQHRMYKLQNYQSFDLGFDTHGCLSSSQNQFYRNETDYLDKISREIDFFIVTDRIQDSVTVLSFILPEKFWKLSDFCLGQFYQQSKIISKLSSSLETKILTHNFMDYKIYLEAVAKLETWIQKIGREIFEARKSQLFEICQLKTQNCKNFTPKNLTQIYYQYFLSDEIPDLDFCDAIKFSPKVFNFLFRKFIYGDSSLVTLENMMAAEQNSHACVNC